MADINPSILLSLFGGGGADPSDIASFGASVRANDIFSQLAPQVGKFQFDRSNFSTGENVLASAGQAFLASALDRIGQNRAADQYAKVAQVLPSLYANPSSVAVPEGVDPEAFGALKLSAISRGAGSKQKAIQELFSKRQEAIASEMGKIQGRQEAYKQMGIKDPEDPLAKITRDLEADTYARITKLPSYVQFSDIDANFRTLTKLAQEDSRPASIGMISALARIWDPQGTVREGEYAINSQAQSALDSILGNWRELILGKGKLSPEGKQTIISAAAQKFNEFGKKYSSEQEELYKALEGQGGARTNIPTPGYTPFDINSFVIPRPISELNQETFNTLRAQGKTPDEIRAMYK